MYIYLCVYTCMCVCMYVCMYVCVYVCMYLCICVSSILNIYPPVSTASLVYWLEIRSVVLEIVCKNPADDNHIIIIMFGSVLYNNV